MKLLLLGLMAVVLLGCVDQRIMEQGNHDVRMVLLNARGDTVQTWDVSSCVLVNRVATGELWGKPDVQVALAPDQSLICVPQTR